MGKKITNKQKIDFIRSLANKKTIVEASKNAGFSVRFGRRFLEDMKKRTDSILRETHPTPVEQLID